MQWWPRSPRPPELALAALLLVGAGAAGAGPEDDRARFLAAHARSFPGVPAADYIYGALAASADARAQYEQIMEFPPFVGDIERGHRLWDAPLADGSRLADCFPDGGAGAAARHPLVEPDGTLVSFERAINRCRERAGDRPWPYGTGLMALATAWGRTLSDGYPMAIRVEGAAALRHYDNGRRLYFRRIGQMNLSCAACHLQYAGHTLRTEILSPAVGQATHWPVFRGGENLTTLQGRYRRCMEQIRAEPPEAGSEALDELEYFHAYLSNGLPLKASVFRK